MPGPIALVGLSAIGGLISTVAKSVIEWLFTKGAKRVAFYTVFLAAIYAAINTFYGVVSSLLASSLSGMPSSLATIAYVFPSNTGACLTAIASVEAAGLAYTFVMKTIKIKMAVVD